jgi:membrane protein
MWKITKAAFWQWYGDNATRMAAALTFYTIFSLAPTFIIVVAITASIVGEPAARQEMVGYLEHYLGPSGARVVVQVGTEARQEASGPLMMALGIGGLIFGSTVAFSELQSAMNTVWKIPNRPGFKGILYQRLVAFLIVLGIAALLLVSVAASTALNFAASMLDGLVAENSAILGLASFLLSFGVLTCAFAIIYRYVPDARIEWRDVWIGALITAVLFTLGKSLIGAYLGTRAIQSVYGAAASLVAVLLWIYYSAQVFFFGAEWTQAFACERGSKIPLRIKREATRSVGKRWRREGKHERENAIGGRADRGRDSGGGDPLATGPRSGRR